VAPLLGNRCCYGNHFAPHSLGVVLVLASKNAVHVTTRNGVMAHFTLIYDVLGVGMCPKMRFVGVTKKGKKRTETFMRQTGYLPFCPDHARRHGPLKFCVRGRVWEIVIYFKFHENRSRGLGAVGGRKSPSPINKAHGLYNSLYYIPYKPWWQVVLIIIGLVCHLSVLIGCATEMNGHFYDKILLFVLDWGGGKR